MTARLVVDEACPHCGAALRLEVQAEVAAVPRPPERVETPPGLFDATADDLAAVERGVRPANWMVPDIVTNGTSNGGVFAAGEVFEEPIKTGEPAPEGPAAPWMPPPGWKPDPNQRYGAPVEDVVLKPSVNGGQGIEPTTDENVREGDLRQRGDQFLDVLRWKYEVNGVESRWCAGATSVIEVLVRSSDDTSPVDESRIESVRYADLAKLPLVNRRRPAWPRGYPKNGDLRSYPHLGGPRFYTWEKDGGWQLVWVSPLRLHGIEYSVPSLLRNTRPWSTHEVFETLMLHERDASLTPPNEVPEDILHPTEETLHAALSRLEGLAVDWTDEDFLRAFLEVVDLASRTDDYCDPAALAKKLCDVWPDPKAVAYSTSPINVDALAHKHGGSGWALWVELRRLADAYHA